MKTLETLTAELAAAHKATAAARANARELLKAETALENVILWRALGEAADADAFLDVVAKVGEARELSDNARDQNRFRADYAYGKRAAILAGSDDDARAKRSPLSVARKMYEEERANADRNAAVSERRKVYGPEALAMIAETQFDGDLTAAAVHVTTPEGVADYEAAMDSVAAKRAVISDATRLLETLAQCSDAVKATVFASLGEAAAAFFAGQEAAREAA